MEKIGKNEKWPYAVKKMKKKNIEKDKKTFFVIFPVVLGLLAPFDCPDLVKKG